jgi:hypothetical protein
LRGFFLSISRNTRSNSLSSTASSADLRSEGRVETEQKDGEGSYIDGGRRDNADGRGRFQHRWTSNRVSISLLKFLTEVDCKYDLDNWSKITNS